MIRAVAAVCFACLMASAALADACLRPLTYTPPRSELERAEPERLAARSLIYPGYDKLVISPSNRGGGLHTIRADRYEPLAQEWPHHRLWDFGRAFQTADGQVYGIGRNPRRLYRLAAGGAAFSQVKLPDFDNIGYDAASDKIVVWTKADQRFWAVENARLTPLDLPPLPDMQSGALPRYVPALEIWLGVTSTRLYAARAGGDWHRMRLGRGQNIRLFQLLAGALHYHAATRVLSLRLGSTVLVYKVDTTGLPAFGYRVEGVSNIWTGGTRAFVAAKGANYNFWGKARGYTDPGKVMLVLGPEGPEEVVDQPLGKLPGQGLHRLNLGFGEGARSVPHSIYHKPPLFKVGGQTFFFDGTHRIAAPALSEKAIGQYPKWVAWQDRVFVLSDRGFAELLPDLTLLELDTGFPLGSTPGVTEIAASPRLGLMIAAKGQLWRTTDGVRFEQLTDGSTVKVRRFLNDLPGRDAALVLGGDGLYLLQPNCE